jgi:hypothetical protein
VQLYIFSRLWKDEPQFAVEQRTRLLRMLRTLFSKYIVWGYQSNLESRVAPRYFICVTIFIFLSLTMGWFLIQSLGDGTDIIPKPL